MAAGPLIGLDLLGDKKLIRSFGRLSRNIQTRVMRPATKAAANVQLPLAKSMASGISTRLGAGLKVKPIKRTRKFIGHKVVTPTREKLAIDPNNRYYWPAAHEYGTIKLRRNSYLRASFLQRVGAMQAKMIQVMRVGIDKEFKRG